MQLQYLLNVKICNLFLEGMVADDDNSEQEDISDRPTDRGTLKEKNFCF